MSRSKAVPWSLLFCMVASPALAGLNAGATATLSWDSTTVVSDLAPP